MTASEIEISLWELWNRAEELTRGSDEYNKIVDEVLAIRSYCREKHIVLSDDISARF